MAKHCIQCGTRKPDWLDGEVIEYRLLGDNESPMRQMSVIICPECMRAQIDVTEQTEHSNGTNS